MIATALQDAIDRIERHNAVERVPYDVMPSGPARTLLRTLALHGLDVRAYESAAGWMLWVGPLARGRAPSMGHVTIAEWRERWAWFAAEMAEGGLQ